MHPKLRSALESIDFLERFESLREQFGELSFPYFTADPNTVKQKIEDLGFETRYFRGERFFKIWMPGRKDQEIVLAVDKAEAAFTFRLRIDDKPVTSAYTSSALELSSDERNAARQYPHARPDFKSYEDLDIILKAGLGMFAEVVKILDEMPSAEN